MRGVTILKISNYGGPSFVTIPRPIYFSLVDGSGTKQYWFFFFLLPLRWQVNKRAMEVWGDEQSLEDEKEKREDNKDKAKRKKYEKRIKGTIFFIYFESI